MTNRDWIINIDNSASIVADTFGEAVVASVFARYGGTCVEDINPCYYSDVFSDLMLMEADCE